MGHCSAPLWTGVEAGVAEGRQLLLFLRGGFPHARQGRGEAPGPSGGRKAEGRPRLLWGLWGRPGRANATASGRPRTLGDSGQGSLGLVQESGEEGLALPSA